MAKNTLQSQKAQWPATPKSVYSVKIKCLCLMVADFQTSYASTFTVEFMSCFLFTQALWSCDLLGNDRSGLISQQWLCYSSRNLWLHNNIIFLPLLQIGSLQYTPYMLHKFSNMSSSNFWFKPHLLQVCLFIPRRQTTDLEKNVLEKWPCKYMLLRTQEQRLQLRVCTAADWFCLERKSRQNKGSYLALFVPNGLLLLHFLISPSHFSQKAELAALLP